MNLRLIAAFLIAPLVLAQYTPPSGGGGGGAVSSVFGRTGTVAAASNDYTAAQVTGAVAGASNLSIAGCVSYQVSSGTLTCVSGLTWDGTNLNVPGKVVIPGVGTGAIDLAIGTAPSNPASGSLALFFNSGNSNHLSTVNSSGSISDLQGSGSGALILLEQHTASSSAELDFTNCISSSYDDYIIRGVALVPATNNVSLEMQYSSNAGSSYITSSSYQWGYWYLRAGATGSGQVSSTGADTSIQIVQGNSNAGTATGGSSFSYNLYAPANGATVSVLSEWAIVQANQASSSSFYRESGIGQIAPAAAINAFRVLFSSGNIATGTVRCYGVAK